MNPTLATQEQPGLGTLTLTEVDPVADLALLATWLGAERARYWGMTDHTVEEIGEVYGWLDEQDTHHAYFVRLDDEPVALVQSYLPEADVIGECYDRQQGDVGLHFFVGPGERRPDFSGRVVVFFARYLFTERGHRRVVVEPDVRNRPAIARLERMGVDLGEIADVPGPLPELPGKTAQFAYMTRERFAALYDVAPAQPSLRTG